MWSFDRGHNYLSFRDVTLFFCPRHARVSVSALVYGRQLVLFTHLEMKAMIASP